MKNQGRQPDNRKALAILNQAKETCVEDGDDWDLEKRIYELEDELSETLPSENKTPSAHRDPEARPNIQ